MAKKSVVKGEWIYGIHSVTELLTQKRRKVFEIYTQKPEPKCFKQIQALLPKYPVAIHRLPKEVLSQKLGVTDHQGIAAYAAPYPYCKKFFNPQTQVSLLMLDGVQDVRNLGAIIRSAYCTGFGGVILLTKAGASVTAAAHKASAGLVERIQIYQAPSAATAIFELKRAGYHIFVTALGGTTDATELEYPEPRCLIVGSEGKGVSSDSKRAGTIVTLPQQVEDISYNASVAAGVMMFMISYLSSKKTLSK